MQDLLRRSPELSPNSSAADPFSGSLDPVSRAGSGTLPRMMIDHPKNQLLRMEATCGSLMLELQVIWDEVGEQDSARDRMLVEVEQECLEVYGRKVDQASRCRAQLRQAIADAEAELAAICSAMGEPPVHIQSNKKTIGLREELNEILPYIEQMKKRKVERWSQIFDFVEKIKKVSSEIRPADFVHFHVPVDQSDISSRKLEELRTLLQSLEKEKCERLKKVMEYLNTLHSLCQVLGIDLKQTVSEIHPSLNEGGASRNISNTTIERLALTIEKLCKTKIQRMQKLQDLSSTMLELWNLMDTPVEQQQAFQNITCNIAASEPEITETNSLSTDFLNYVEAEVGRLEQLKASKMKELVLKKQIELEEYLRRAHLAGEEGYATHFSIQAIESGVVDPSLMLEQIEACIATVKEEAFSRRDILERVDRWLNACEEETWLENYTKDDNRYNAGRGAHIMLNRAEKARVVVNKIPGTVDVLRIKIIAWEKERGTAFTYHGVRLLSMLDEYMVVRQAKEQDKKKQRDHKKLQGQFKVEQETLYGSKPSPSSKAHSTKKVPRKSTAAASRRLSLGAGRASIPPPKPEILHSKSVRAAKRTEGSRGVDITSLPIKKLSFNTSTHGEIEMETPREPFTQIIPRNSVTLTPVKPISNGTEGEIGTPKTMGAPPPPKTPMAVITAIQLARTPATATRRDVPVYLVADDKPELASLEDSEYSFEERRLAVYLASQAA